MSKDANTTPSTDETPVEGTPVDETSTTKTSGETPETSPSTTPSTEPTTTTPETAPETSSDETKLEIERLKDALKKANKEAAAHRVKANELDKLKADIEAEKLTEKERLEKKLADLQKSHDDAVRSAQEYRVNTEVRMNAVQLGFADPADASRFLEYAEIEYADDGTPSNVGDLLKAVLKQKPYLAVQTKSTQTHTSGGATNPPRSQTNQPTALSWETIPKMTQAEYTARHAEIQAWIAKNMPQRGLR